MDTATGSTSRGEELKIAKLSKSFGSVKAIDNLDLVVEPGALIALLGPSGCGKTTTLRIVAGFEAPDRGSVTIGTRDLSRLPPDKRGLGMVFQNYSLFPHMTVGENVAFGLRMKRTPAAEERMRVRDILNLVHLGGFEDRFSFQLSGGQQQRVALARSLITKPSVLLLDEPLGALDKNLREMMQFELRRIQQSLGITTILVTHDQEEAMTLSDRIVVMNKGRILQSGTPQELYDHPGSRFVAEFLGTSNLFEGSLGPSTGSGRRSFTLACQAADSKIEIVEVSGDQTSGPMALAVRPEKMFLRNSIDDDFNHAAVEITGHVFRGTYHAYEVRLYGRADPMLVYDQARSHQQDRTYTSGESAVLCWRREDSVLLQE